MMRLGHMMLVKQPYLEHFSPLHQVHRYDLYPEPDRHTPPHTYRQPPSTHPTPQNTHTQQPPHTRTEKHTCTQSRLYLMCVAGRDSNCLERKSSLCLSWCFCFSGRSTISGFSISSSISPIGQKVKTDLHSATSRCALMAEF